MIVLNNMLKKLITFLILMAVVVPAGAGAVTRPTTLLEQCTLRHDWTEDFGNGYEKSASITSVEASGSEVTDFESGGNVDLRTLSIWDKEQVYSYFTFAKAHPTQDAQCMAAITAIEADYMINEARYDLLNNKCGGIGIGWAKNRALEIIRGASAGISIIGYRKDAAVVCMLDLLETIGDWIFVVVLIIAVIFLIFAGYVFITGAGAPEKITKARNMLVWGLVGVAVAILSKGLITLVEQLIT